jgi:serine-type D-Ala-D-Ala carboxypeptidase/endopeptidase (penicillin-binding protein 4)
MAMKIRVVFAIFAISSLINHVSAQENKIENAIQKFINAGGLEHAAISFEVIDLSTNASVAAYNSKMALPPASTVKLFSTATAMLEIGPYYRPETQIYYKGDIDSNGILHGDLVIRGGGDPSLGSRFFEKSGEERQFLASWAEQIKAFGIREIRGGIIADGSAFGYVGAPEGWTWGDMGNYYGSGPAGITLFDNMSYLTFETSSKVNGETQIVCMEPYIHGLSYRNEVKAGTTTHDNAYAYGAPYQFQRLIQGTLPLKQSEFDVKVSIPDPEYLMAQELHTSLTSNGVVIASQPVGVRKMEQYEANFDKRKLIVNHQGQTIANIAYWTNMRSVNLFAEQLLCLTGYVKRGSGTTATGAWHIQNYWEPLIGKGFHITDGSGLSRNNAVSAHHFVKMLAHINKSDMNTEFRKTLPVAGKSGTLSSLCRGQAASGRISAKSGTMNRIKAYSGYVTTTTGKELAFAFIVNNHSISSSELVKKMETVFNAIAQY